MVSRCGPLNEETQRRPGSCPRGMILRAVTRKSWRRFLEPTVIRAPLDTVSSADERTQPAVDGVDVRRHQHRAVEVTHAGAAAPPPGRAQVVGDAEVAVGQRAGRPDPDHGAAREAAAADGGCGRDRGRQPLRLPCRRGRALDLRGGPRSGSGWRSSDVGLLGVEAASGPAPGWGWQWAAPRSWWPVHRCRRAWRRAHPRPRPRAAPVPPPPPAPASPGGVSFTGPNPRHVDPGSQPSAAGVDAQGRHAAVGLEPQHVGDDRHRVVSGVAHGVGQGHGALGQVDVEGTEHRVAGLAGGADRDLVRAGGHVGLANWPLVMFLKAAWPSTQMSPAPTSAVWASSTRALPARDGRGGSLVGADHRLGRRRRPAACSTTSWAVTGLDGDAGRRGCPPGAPTKRTSWLPGCEVQGTEHLAERDVRPDGLAVDLDAHRRSGQRLDDVDRAAGGRQRHHRGRGRVDRVERAPPRPGSEPVGLAASWVSPAATMPTTSASADEQPVAQRPLVCAMTSPHGLFLSHGSPVAGAHATFVTTDAATRARPPDQTPARSPGMPDGKPATLLR